MKNFPDEEVQAHLDAMSTEERTAWAGRGEAKGKNAEDVGAYLLIYDALEEPPSASLSPDFAAATAHRAFASDTVSSAAGFAKRAWLEHAGVTALLVLATAVAFLLIPGGFDFESFSFTLDSFAALSQLWQHARADLIVAAALVVLVLGLLDHVLPFQTKRRNPASSG